MENWELWSQSIQNSSSLPILTPHTFPVAMWVLLRGCTPSDIPTPRWALQKTQSFRKYPSSPQWSSTGCKVLQHLKDFLPSSFFDRDVTGLFITVFPSLLIAPECFPVFKKHFPRGTASMDERLSCAMHGPVGGTWNCLCPSQHSHSRSSQTPFHSSYGQGLGTCT